MKVAIITTGYLPVPASKGGAVESIVDNIIKENEIFNKMQLEIFSCFDKDAYDKSNKLKYTKIDFIKIPKLIKLVDKIIKFIATKILNKKNIVAYSYIAQRLYFLNNVSKKLKKYNYDKIILENHASLFLALKWRKNYKKYSEKYYYHIHNEMKSFYGCEEIIKKCKKILCVSEYIKIHVEKKLKSKNAFVLTNCIDTDKFNGILEKEEKALLKKKYKIGKNDIVLLFTGRLNKEKGIEELLKAISEIKLANFKLLIVGSFFFGINMKGKFEKKISELIHDVKDKVIFTGYVPYDEIQKIYAMADIATLPSIWEDPAPLTIIESMASGLPIITTNSGGIPEYAQNGCAIILKKEEDLIEKLKESIEILIKDKQRRNEMSEISKENAKILNLNNFYNNLLAFLK